METRSELTALRVVVESLIKTLSADDRRRLAANFEEGARLVAGSRGSALSEQAAQQQQIALSFWRYVVSGPAAMR
jgi:hypothetical protein